MRPLERRTEIMLSSHRPVNIAHLAIGESPVIRARCTVTIYHISWPGVRQPRRDAAPRCASSTIWPTRCWRTRTATGCPIYSGRPQCRPMSSRPSSFIVDGKVYNNQMNPRRGAPEALSKRWASGTPTATASPICSRGGMFGATTQVRQRPRCRRRSCHILPSIAAADPSGRRTRCRCCQAAESLRPDRAASARRRSELLMNG